MHRARDTRDRSGDSVSRAWHWAALAALGAAEAVALHAWAYRPAPPLVQALLVGGAVLNMSAAALWAGSA